MTDNRAVIEERWQEAWPRALALWSPFTRLRQPRWCWTDEEAQSEGLTGSFAMIRLNDHAVVVNLAEIAARGIDGFALEVLAHEIGHHVLAPADLRDNARLMARIRVGLPGIEKYAPMVANLWSDLLINDRLQRSHGLDLAGVYRGLGKAGKDQPRSWRLYLGICEELWRLPKGTLAETDGDEALKIDVRLGARTVRVYAHDWLIGASRFACLLLPYLIKEAEQAASSMRALMDAIAAGAGSEPPDGLADLEEGEGDAIHPVEDPLITDLDDAEAKQTGGDGIGTGPVMPKDHRTVRGRDPLEYIEIMRSIGVEMPEREIVMRYYRELARPYLVRFPTQPPRRAGDPLPEGLESWDLSDPIHELNWIETAARGGVVVPGATTLRRTWGEDQGMENLRPEPFDLYLGIDCSGSMGDPARQLSYPILAGTVVALSALRVRARCFACLSGEPGKFEETNGYVAVECDILRVLTGYIGTGYSFGIERLRHAFLGSRQPRRPTHILVLSDSDWFEMLERGAPDAWEVARRAAEIAGGGATAVLRIERSRYRKHIARLESIGWNVHDVVDDDSLVSFARAFSRARYAARVTA
jgi:hypothetical protein